MSANTRPCLVCDDAPELHDTDPDTADHVYEPAELTPAEAATLVAWVAARYGADAAHDTATEIGDQRGHDSEVGQAAHRVANAAAEADREAAEAERAVAEADKAAASAPACEGTREAWGTTWCASCADRGVWHGPATRGVLADWERELLASTDDAK